MKEIQKIKNIGNIGRMGPQGKTRWTRVFEIKECTIEDSNIPLVFCIFYSTQKYRIFRACSA